MRSGLLSRSASYLPEQLVVLESLPHRDLLYDNGRLNGYRRDGMIAVVKAAAVKLQTDNNSLVDSKANGSQGEAV